MSIKREGMALTLVTLTLILSIPAVLGSDTVSTNSTPGIHGNETKDNHTDGSHGDGHHEHVGVHVASIRYHEIQEPFVFTLVVLLAALSKLGFHYADKLSSIVPESCLLIVIGTIFGAIIHFSGIGGKLPEFFTPDSFFNFLLPPIILESAFHLYDRTFSENLGSVIIFAVLGTIASCTLLGLSLIGLKAVGAMEHFGATPIQLLVFASLIVAVDPVAVLAVFNEIGVNRVLYFLVFGESLLNDGVTVVLYNVLQAYNRILQGADGVAGRAITAEDIILGILRFFVVCLGGLSIGIIMGALSAVMTKYTQTVKVVEPVVIFGMAYLAFLFAEMFHFSGIISIVGCGMMQVAYSFHNITPKSKTTVKFFTRVLSTTSEIIIFLFLGLILVNPDHDWKTGFTLWTIVLCTLFRFLIVFAISTLINRYDHYRVRKIYYDEMFIMSYGGLRGAVCFSLVALLDVKEFGEETKNVFVTTTLAVILFTVFIQGGTIKPIVGKLRVRLAPESHQTMMYEELHSHINDHLMACVEEIVGNEGKNALRSKITRIDDKYIKKLLLRDFQLTDESVDLVNCYEKLIMKEHYRNLHLCGAHSLPSQAEHMRSLDSSVLLSQLARESKHIEDEEAGGKEEEVEEETPSKVEFEIGDAKGFRNFLNIHAQRPQSRMNVYGFNKKAVNQDNEKYQLQRKMTLLNNITNKRKNNHRLQRMKTISSMRERSLSWCEDDSAARMRKHGKTDNGRQRAMTMDVSPTKDNLKFPLKFDTIPEHVDTGNEDEVVAEKRPLLEASPESVDNGEADRHCLHRQGAISSDEIPMQSLKRTLSQ